MIENYTDNQKHTNPSETIESLSKQQKFKAVTFQVFSAAASAVCINTEIGCQKIGINTAVKVPNDIHRKWAKVNCSKHIYIYIFIHIYWDPSTGERTEG